MKAQCTILISSCDNYSDLWDPFFDLFLKFWPDNYFEIVLSTESSLYFREDLNIKNIHPNKGTESWSRRISDTLDQINTPQVLFILDDFFFFDYVKTKELEKCIQWLNSNPNIATFTFWPISSDGTISKKYPGFEKRPLKAHNKVAAILGVWNKEQLSKYVKGYDENAWQWEYNALIRSNELYPEDEFYVTQSNDNPIFSYDFTKYGLVSGKWFKETKEKFEELNIDIKFSKRGFHNPIYRGLQQSIVSIFDLDSKMIPWYALKNKQESFFENTHSLSSNRMFKQKYEIANSFGLLRWEPATQWGFGIDNFTIVIEYLNGKKEEIDQNNIFGNFIFNNKRLLFNSVTPNMYIFIRNKKKLKSVVLSGKIIMPLTKKELKISFNKETKIKNKKDQEFYELFWNQYITISQKVIHVKLDSKIQIKKYEKSKIEKQMSEIRKEGIFKQKYLSENVEAFSWLPSSSGGYTIKNLDFLILTSKGKRRIKKKELLNLPKKIKDEYVFLSNTPIIWENKNREEIKEIIISGDMNKPISPRTIRKYMYDCPFKNYYNRIRNRLFMKKRGDKYEKSESIFDNSGL